MHQSRHAEVESMTENSTKENPPNSEGIFVFFISLKVKEYVFGFF